MGLFNDYTVQTNGLLSQYFSRAFNVPITRYTQPNRHLLSGRQQAWEGHWHAAHMERVCSLQGALNKRLWPLHGWEAEAEGKGEGQWKAAESGWRKVPRWGPSKEASKCWHLYLSSSLQFHPESPSVSTVGRAVSPMISISLMALLTVRPERSCIGSWPGRISNFKIGNNVTRLVLLDLSLGRKCGTDAEGKAEMHSRKSEDLWGPWEKDFSLNQGTGWMFVPFVSIRGMGYRRKKKVWRGDFEFWI